MSSEFKKNPNTTWKSWYIVTQVAVGTENSYHTDRYSLGEGKWCFGRARAKRYPTSTAAHKAARRCRVPVTVIKCISAITNEVEV